MRVFYKSIFALNAIFNVIVVVLYISYLSKRNESVISFFSLAFVDAFILAVCENFVDILVYLVLSVIFLGSGLIYFLSKLESKHQLDLSAFSTKKQLMVSKEVAVVILIFLGILIYLN